MKTEKKTSENIEKNGGKQRRKPMENKCQGLKHAENARKTDCKRTRAEKKTSQKQMRNHAENIQENE